MKVKLGDSAKLNKTQCGGKSKMHLVKFDWFMKKMMRDKSDYVVLEGFLSALTKKQITIKSILESESNKTTKDEKYNRVDILVEDELGEKIIVEIQRQSEYDYYHRVLFGTAKVITENMKEGESYLEVPKVISVSILYFNISKGEDYLYYGTTEFKGVHTNEKLETTNLMDRSEFTKGKKDPFPEYYFINVNKFDGIVKEDIDEWIYMFKNSKIEKSFNAKGIQVAGKKLDFENLTKEEKKNYENHMKNIMIEKSMFDTSWYEGKEEGRLEGKEEGRLEGKEEGRLEGMAEGLEQKSIEVAKSLKAKGLEISLIVEVTGLPKEEIEKL